MFQKAKSFFSTFRSDEDGATLVEYGIAIGLAVLVGGGALSALGKDVSNSMKSAGEQLPENSNSVATTSL